MARQVTLELHIRQEEEKSSVLEPKFSTILTQMAFAAKQIALEIHRATLVGKLGLAGKKNITGDAQKKLDIYTNEVIMDAFVKNGLVAAMVSEEMEVIHHIVCTPESRYILCIDPLDGSSNTDINGAVGTIFSLYKRTHEENCDAIEEELWTSSKLVAAGYVFYGPSTIFVYTVGNQVHEFTLDPGLGEFILSKENIRSPSKGNYYSANLGNYHHWDFGTRKYIDYLMELDAETDRPYSLRYSGALVADFHRILLLGGIYLYPGDKKHPEGKLRFYYECAPLAFIAEQAGGKASTGSQRVLDLNAHSIHQTCPLAIGSSQDVEQYKYSLKQEVKN
ncbi:MAG: class 1 fructose-bisphosphatase [Bacteroidetes bacterium]|nr:class 1 fructose-bisphosphatase [Bacteroidota bacterium]